MLRESARYFAGLLSGNVKHAKCGPAVDEFFGRHLLVGQGTPLSRASTPLNDPIQQVGADVAWIFVGADEFGEVDITFAVGEVLHTAFGPADGCFIQSGGTVAGVEALAAVCPRVCGDQLGKQYSRTHKVASREEASPTQLAFVVQHVTPVQDAVTLGSQTPPDTEVAVHGQLPGRQVEPGRPEAGGRQVRLSSLPARLSSESGHDSL